MAAFVSIFALGRQAVPWSYIAVTLIWPSYGWHLICADGVGNAYGLCHHDILKAYGWLSWSFPGILLPALWSVSLIAFVFRLGLFGFFRDAPIVEPHGWLNQVKLCAQDGAILVMNAAVVSASAITTSVPLYCALHHEGWALVLTAVIHIAIYASGRRYRKFMEDKQLRIPAWPADCDDDVGNTALLFVVLFSMIWGLFDSCGGIPKTPGGLCKASDLLGALNYSLMTTFLTVVLGIFVRRGVEISADIALHGAARLQRHQHVG